MDTARRPPPPGAPPPPIDPRGPPPPPPSHYTSQQPSYYPHPPPHPAQSPYPAHSGPPGSAPPGQVHTLPPIHGYSAPYPPGPGPPPGEGPHQLPPVRHPSHGYYDSRDQQEYHKYNQASRSGHATPAPVNRSYSHDSTHQQHTPTTPAQPGAYPPTSAPEAGPPPHHMDHGSQHGYPPTNGIHSNGHPPPPPPQHYDPHPPHPMTPSVDQGYAYPPPQHQMYPPPQYGPPIAASYNTQARKKQMRAQQACEQCRQRKQKCDEGTPCSFCKESNLSCQYRDTPPAKTDKNMEKVIEMLTENADMARSNTQTLTKLSATVQDFDSRLRRMEDNRGNTVGGAEDEIVYTEELAQPKRQKNLDDHRTAPHKLILLWPSLGPLFAATQDKLTDGYVMEAEDRGLPRIYGRGEGIDEEDGTRQGGTHSPARTEESSPETFPPTPPDGQWGYGFASQQYLGQDPSRSQPYPAGGLKPDGTLDLDATTIDALYNSYVKHMHIMHPFLDEKGTKELVRKFSARYSPGRSRLQGSQFVGGIGGNESDRPLKRQRSNGPSATSESYPTRVVQTERSPGNAIVYLVLALGKICSHKEQLPGVVQDRVLESNQVLAHSITGNPGFADSSPMSMNIKPSPSSPNLTPNNLATPPAHENGARAEARSRRSSIDGAPSSTSPRNMDVIPGMAYYAKAAEILGDQADGNDLIHAQMFLLAGLYKGQLARVIESMSWITMAGRVIQILLDRYKLYNHNYWTAYGDIKTIHKSDRERIKNNRQGRIVLAAWTCLQLESDILAELRFPSSGIQSIENLLVMPLNLRDEDDSEAYTELQDVNDQMVLIFYTAQMFLRRRLNQIHREMYGPECMEQTLPEVKQILIGHVTVIEEWRKRLPPPLQWKDDDPPPKEILHARLRAKYWGAKYVVNRVFLDYALHIMSHVAEKRRVEDVALDVRNQPRDPAEVHLFKAIQNMGEPHVWQASQECIKAAMHSTVAFDGVPDRLIVTNIHGTAHAQFGNMLVLAAAYNHQVLRQLVPADRFSELLERTIRFLRRLSPISSTCKQDCGILEKLSRHLFPVKDDVKAVYRNEGIVESVSASNSFTT
nr:hypothetical protein B0A51_15582 [Rachicladosporium sp. CCFEE 5018]